MTTRTIMLFPEFDNMDIIHEIRRRYDPLWALVPPHITLVFPFESELTDEALRLHIREHLKGVAPFDIAMQGFRKQEDRHGYYLFLDVINGAGEIADIHARLYRDALAPFDSGRAYMPHMTVGRVSCAEALNEAFVDASRHKDTFGATVRRVSVEMIGPHEESIIIIEHELTGN